MARYRSLGFEGRKDRGFFFSSFFLLSVGRSILGFYGQKAWFCNWKDDDLIEQRVDDPI